MSHDQIILQTNEHRRLAAVVKNLNMPISMRRAARDKLIRLTAEGKNLLTAKKPTQPPAPSTPTVDAGWIWLATYRLEIAAVAGDQSRVEELRAQFLDRGLEIPAHRGYTPLVPVAAPEPDRPAALLPPIDERGRALHTIRVLPKGQRVTEYDDWNF